MYKQAIEVNIAYIDIGDKDQYWYLRYIPFGDVSLMLVYDLSLQCQNLIFQESASGADPLKIV